MMNEEALNGLALIAKEILSINCMLKKASIDISNIDDDDILDDVSRLAEDIGVVKTLLCYFKEDDITLELNKNYLPHEDVTAMFSLLKEEPFKSL